jgi:hypothetical protein
MSYTNETGEVRGYPHGECLKCHKETQPARECECPERQPDGSWVEPEDENSVR